MLGKTWQSAGKKVGLEDKFIVRIPDVEILIVPDNQRFSYRECLLKKLFVRIFTPKVLMQKYKTANKTLDIINLIAAAATEEEKEKAIAKILSDAFERSCILFDGYKIAVSYGGEDIRFLMKRTRLPLPSGARQTVKAAAAERTHCERRKEFISLWP